VVTDEADNCDGAPVVAFVSDNITSATCDGAAVTVLRTYSVTDCSGNSITVTQTINVDDITNPTASNPATVNVECFSDIPAANIAVVTDEADNCDGAPVVAFVSDNITSATCDGAAVTVLRTYSVTDCSGNSINVVQTINVDDVTNPTASNPVTVNVECFSDIPAANIAVVTDEADNCDGTPVVAFVSDNITSAVCDGASATVLRTYSVTDCSGNSIDVTQAINVDDVTNPTASNPSAINLECFSDIPAANIAVVTDEADNCDGAVTVAFVSDNITSATCDGTTVTVLRTYSVTDCSGNSINVTQTINVDDVTNPTASNPATVNVECFSDIPAANIAVVTDEADNCDGTPVVAFVNDNITSAVCDGASATVLRTYSVTDCSGNSINVVQTINVDDATNPTASNPSTVNVECFSDIPAANIAVVTDEADNCNGAPVVAFVNDNITSATCDGATVTVLRTYSVTDCSGNSINVTQTINVDDVTNPTASNPATVNVECFSDIPAPSVAVVTDEVDNCDGAPVVAFVNDNITSATCDGATVTVLRTYSVTDCSGNSINVAQTINVDDATNPTASNPATVNVECFSDIPAANVAVVTDEADNCDGTPVVAFVSDNITSAVCDGASATVLRTYSVTDCSGNSIEVVQTINVDDVTNPTASNPAAVTVECFSDIPAVNIAVVTDEADNCDGAPVVAFVSDNITSASCDGAAVTVLRTYSVTDCSGNSINVVQTINVDDVTNPTASNPAAVTVECFSDIPTANIAVVTDEADNCDGTPVVAFVNDNITSATCDGSAVTVLRTYSVTDCSGNSINVVQTINVDDVTNPTASNPAPVNVECFSDIPAPSVAVVTDEADNCDGAPVVAFVNDNITSAVCDGATATVLRTYSVSDCSGNSINVVQTINVDDVTNPSFTRPADITLYKNSSCTVNDSPYGAGDVTNESDNCGSPLNATYSDVLVNNCQGTYTITRTWHLEDCAGNAAADQVQTITVLDTIKPTFTHPADITIFTNANCSYDASVTATGDVINEADNCSTGLQATFSDVTVNGSCEGTHVITRTWSLVDNCGNAAANQIQTILVNDNTVPTFTRPANITVYTDANCIYDATITVTGDVTNEADNCSTGIQATFTDVNVAGSCQGSRIINRTWHLVDYCGNAAADQIQIITVSDTIKPTFTRPSDITIYTNAACVYNALPSATGDVSNEADNCSTGLNATYTDVNVEGSCQGARIITRTWHLVDNCGNAAPDQIQVITVSDTIKPTFTRPADITIFTSAGCAYNALPIATGDVFNEVDNCSTGINATYTDVTVAGPYVGSYNITRTWSLVDNCGNTAADQVQTILVRDNTAPVLNCPANVTASYNVASCSLTVSNPVYSDNCNIASVSWVMTGATTGSSSLTGINHLGTQSFNLGVTTITYSVKDSASNTSTCSFTVTVNPASTVSSVTVNPSTVQYSDQVTFTATIAGGAGTCVPNAAVSVTFTVGTQVMGTVAMTSVGSNLVGTLTTELLEPTLSAGNPPAGQMSPYISHTVTATFNTIDPHYAVTNNPTASLVINQEDARASYSGILFVATASSSTTSAPVLLTATIKDINAVPVDPAYDAFAGDIRNARVKFVNRDNNSDISGWLIPTLINNSDSRIGSVSYLWNVSLGNQASVATTVGIVVDNGYYFRNTSDDNSVVTVYKPVGDFISGGGYIIPTSSAGTYASDPGTKTNFGFNVKYNNNATNLQGKMNFIFRRTVAGELHTFQIKANSLQSLGVNVTDASRKTAQFLAKSTLTDITDPLNPISLGGNKGLFVNIIDRGEPGVDDSISVVLTNSFTDNPTILANILYTSNWIVSQTEQMRLAAGNVLIHSGFSFKPGEAPSEETIQPVSEPNKADDILSINYPNPFNSVTTIAFSVPDGYTMVKVFNPLGQCVSTLFNGTAEKGTLYKVDFDGSSYTDGMYFYTISTVGKEEKRMMILMK
jgi:hypothetical protein